MPGSIQAAANAVNMAKNYAAKEIKETAEIVQKAVGKVGEVFEGVNMEENTIVQEEEIVGEPNDIPSRDVAALIASVNSIDLQLIYSQQVREVRKLTQDGAENIKEQF